MSNDRASMITAAGAVATDGVTVTGNGTTADPIRALFGSEPVVADGITILGDGTTLTPLRVNPDLSVTDLRTQTITAGEPRTDAVPFSLMYAGNESLALKVLVDGVNVIPAPTFECFAALTKVTASVDTTAGPVTACGIQATADATRSAGTNLLTNIGVLAAGTDYCFFGSGGTLRNDNDNLLGPTSAASLSVAGGLMSVAADGTVDLGHAVKSFSLPITVASPTPHIEVGVNRNDFAQLNLKTSDPAQTLGGAQIALDTAINPAIRGGLILWRGAGGGFGGGVEAGFVIAAAPGFPFNLSAANDTGLLATGGRLTFGASSSFELDALIDTAGHFAARDVRTGGADVNGVGTGATWASGNGDPTGARAGNKGDMFSRLDGAGPNTTLYVCTTTGTPGTWAAVA